MTIASFTSRIGYIGDGVTTAFAVPFYFSSNADIVVTVQDLSGNVTTKTLGTHYNLTGATLSGGGTCTFTTATTTGFIIAITRVPPITQTTSYNNNDPFPAKSHELALDKATTVDQYLKTLIDRAIIVAPTDTPPMTTLPPASVRALKNLSFDALGNPSVSIPVTGTTVSSAMIPIVTASTLPIARTALGIDGTANSFATRALAIAATIDASVQSIRIAGYAAAGDGGVALYKRVVSLTAGASGFQSADGAWWQLSESIVSVKMTGAVGDGATDDTTKIQAAITHVQVTGGVLFFPPGTYKITSALSITSGLTIQGSGRQTTVIAPATFINAISINTAASIVIRDICISYAASATSAAIGINVTATTENVGSRFENLWIIGAYAGITFTRASHFVVDGCLIQSFTNAGITVQNTNNVDSGDSTIVNTEILSAGIAGSLTGIIYLSAGGLRIENCKINEVTTGVTLAYNGTATASDLLIVGCSIEGTSMTSGVALTRTTSTGNWVNVIIANNEFEVVGASGVCINIPLDATGNWLTDVNISGNIFFMGTGTPSGVNVASVSGFSALNNNFISQNAASVANIIGASVTAGLVGLSTKRGTFAASANNAGAAVTTVAPF